MVHKVYLVKNLDLSIDFITDIIDGTVFFVISNDDQHVLPLIDKFDRDYDRYSPITWYTRQTFLYKMLNQALRINDVRTLFFLHNPCKNFERFNEPVSSETSLKI